MKYDNNSYTYLYDNAENGAYYLNNVFFSTEEGYAIIIDGEIRPDYAEEGPNAVRPTITLLNTSMWSSGSGTSIDPYEIVLND